MSYRQAFRTVIAVLLLGQALLSSMLAAQSPLERGRELYLAADYEAALAALGDLRTSGAEATEAGTYRMLCLLALGRTLEATREIEAVVAIDPFYQPPDTMASPRVRDLFRQTRLKALPAVAQREYATAKAAFDRRDPDSAKMFERVLAILAEPGLRYSSAADLRLLASGFRDLSREFAVPKPLIPQPAAAQAAAGPPPARPPTEVQQADATTPDAKTASTRATARPAPAASAAPAAPPRGLATAPEGPPAHEGDPGVTPPVPIDQPMPRWIPPADSAARREQFEGILELLIDTRGSVTNATLRAAIHPEFDEELLKVARTWTFKPATRAGAPTPYLKYLHVRLSPPR